MPHKKNSEVVLLKQSSFTNIKLNLCSIESTASAQHEQPAAVRVVA